MPRSASSTTRRTRKEDPFGDDVYVALDEEPDEPEGDELGRLESEIAESQRIQQALETFIAALDAA